MEEPRVPDEQTPVLPRPGPEARAGARPETVSPGVEPRATAYVREEVHRVRPTTRATSVDRSQFEYVPPESYAFHLGDRIRWGPVWAGLLATFSTLILLSVLGLAAGVSTLRPGQVPNDLGPPYAIWTGVAAIIAFFIGGWVAARATPTPGRGWGMAHGAMVWALVIPLALFLTAAGTGAIVGYTGPNLGDLGNLLQGARAARPDEVQNAMMGAWGVFISLLAALVAAALGGLAGSHAGGVVDEL